MSEKTPKVETPKTDAERIAALESQVTELTGKVNELPAAVCSVVGKTLDKELEAVIVSVCHKHASEFWCAGVAQTMTAPFRAVGRLFSRRTKVAPAAPVAAV